MASSYFLERARNPYLGQPLTGSPEQSDEDRADRRSRGRARVAARPRPEMPPAISPMPDLSRPVAGEIPGGAPGAMPDALRPSIPAEVPPLSPANQIALARDEYMGQVPQGFKAHAIEALKTAGLGFLQGAANNPNDPLGAGVGGAITGGAISAVATKVGRGYQFETIKRPQMEQNIARRQQEEDRARTIEAEKFKQEQARTQGGFDLGPGQKRFDATGKEIASVPATQPAVQPLRANDPRLGIEPTSGKSYKQIAIESYQARGGDNYVLSQMPPRLQQLIQRGTVTTSEIGPDGKPTGQMIEQDASAAEIQEANRMFQGAIERQKQADLDYTQGEVMGSVLRGPQKAQAPAAPQKQPAAQQPAQKQPAKAASQSGQKTANLTDLTKKHWR